jgi:hypothetical protein
MKNFILVFILLGSMSIISCNDKHAKHSAKTTNAAVPGAKYICPMNCEDGKTYDEPGTCPVCNMDLEPMEIDESASSMKYFTQYSSKPEQLEAGKEAIMSFTPKIEGDEAAAVPLELVHEKKMHLILVSDDLSWFDHIHPEYQATGNYDIKALAKGASFAKGRGLNETRFEAGGKYWAFADFKPSGGLNQVNKIELNIAGTPAKAVKYSQAKMISAVDGYTLTLETGHTGNGLVSGVQQHIPITIQQGGKAVDPASFENYLGEKAHLVLIEVENKEYVHTHPSATGGKLDVHTTFAKPGTYRGWLQFQTNGVVHTADFVVKVAEGQHNAEEHSDHQGH